jgi:heme A synthase
LPNLGLYDVVLLGSPVRGSRAPMITQQWPRRMRVIT